MALATHEGRKKVLTAKEGPTLRYSHLALLFTCFLTLVTGLSFSAQLAQASLAVSRAPSTEVPSLLTGGCIPGSFTNRVLLGDGLGEAAGYRKKEV